MPLRIPFITLSELSTSSSRSVIVTFHHCHYKTLVVFDPHCCPLPTRTIFTQWFHAISLHSSGRDPLESSHLISIAPKSGFFPSVNLMTACGLDDFVNVPKQGSVCPLRSNLTACSFVNQDTSAFSLLLQTSLPHSLDQRSAALHSYRVT